MTDATDKRRSEPRWVALRGLLAFVVLAVMLIVAGVAIVAPTLLELIALLIWVLAVSAAVFGCAAEAVRAHASRPRNVWELLQRHIV